MTPFITRMVRAAQFDAAVYEEIEADKGAMGQATAVVVLSSVAAGIGMVGRIGAAGIFWGTLVALLTWYVWAYVTFVVGTKFLPEPQTSADHGQLLRTIGFSSSPGLLRALGIVPGLGDILIFVAGVWMLAAMVIAVRQALDYSSTLRAVGVCIVGWLLQALIIILVFGAAGLLRSGS